MSKCEKIEYSDALENAVENANWGITGIYFTDDGSKEPFYLELYGRSPEGEDLSGECVWFDGTDEGLKAALAEHAESFDPDEHAELYINMRGKQGVPNSIRALIDDADAIKKMLQELSDKVSEVTEPLVILGEEFNL